MHRVSAGSYCPHVTPSNFGTSTTERCPGPLPSPPWLRPGCPGPSDGTGAEDHCHQGGRHGTPGQSATQGHVERAQPCTTHLWKFPSKSRNKKLLGAPGIATRSKDAPGLTTRNKYATRNQMNSANVSSRKLSPVPPLGRGGASLKKRLRYPPANLPTCRLLLLATYL